MSIKNTRHKKGMKFLPSCASMILVIGHCQLKSTAQEIVRTISGPLEVNTNFFFRYTHVVYVCSNYLLGC